MINVCNNGNKMNRINAAKLMEWLLTWTAPLECPVITKRLGLAPILKKGSDWNWSKRPSDSWVTPQVVYFKSGILQKCHTPKKAYSKKAYTESDARQKWCTAKVEHSKSILRNLLKLVITLIDGLPQLANEANPEKFWIYLLPLRERETISMIRTRTVKLLGKIIYHTTTAQCCNEWCYQSKGNISWGSQCLQLQTGPTQGSL